MAPSQPDQRTIGAPLVSLAMPRDRRQAGRLKNEPVAGNKRVLLAAPRGYCAGVDRAVVAVKKALQRYGAPVYVRKQIVVWEAAGVTTMVVSPRSSDQLRELAALL